MKALSGHRVVQVSLGSRDAQTLALTEDGTVYSWGDGDFGKLGRGGSDGCNVPHVVDRLNGLGVCQIECGAQFSLALTKSGQVWTWSVTSSCSVWHKHWLKFESYHLISRCIFLDMVYYYYYYYYYYRYFELGKNPW